MWHQMFVKSSVLKGCVAEQREAEHTFSITELTIKGFFRMCWPTPVLNMIPVTDMFWAPSFNQY